MTWAMKIVQKPSWPAKPPGTNRASSDEPITISGAAIGRKIDTFIVLRPSNWWRTSANAISVPRMVAMMVASKPIWMLTTAPHMPAAPHRGWSSCPR